MLSQRVWSCTLTTFGIAVYNHFCGMSQSGHKESRDFDSECVVTQGSHSCAMGSVDQQNQNVVHTTAAPYAAHEAASVTWQQLLIILQDTIVLLPHHAIGFDFALAVTQCWTSNGDICQLGLCQQ